MDWQAERPPISAAQERCTRCGAAFACSPQGGCWCMELPPTPVVGDQCLCRDCLQALIRGHEARV
jgi:hypothetical protein